MLNLGLNSLKKLGIDFVESYKMKQNIRKAFIYDSLKKARISAFNAAFNNFIKLQTPGQLGVWGDTAFLTITDPDVDIVINKPNPYVPLSKDIEKNWMLHIEPPGYIKKLGLDQSHITEKFGRVYTCAPHLYEQGGKYIASPPYVHWHLAINSYTNRKENFLYDYDFLVASRQVPEKEFSLAAINSKMNNLPGHQLRAKFVSAICDAGIDMQLYGADTWSRYKQYKGSAMLGKWPVFSNAKYALAIENEVSDYYWTEKFTDAILCYSMPIYYGSPKIGSYFPKGSYIAIDINRNDAIDHLKEILKSDYFEKNLPALLEARELILTRYNMFNFFNSNLINK